MSLLYLCLMPFGILATGFFLERRIFPRPAFLFFKSFPLLLPFSLGLIFFSYYWFLMALFGWIQPFAFLVWLVFAAAAFLMEHKRLHRGSRHLRRWKQSLKDESWLFYGALGLVMAVLFLTLIRCFSGYIEGDSLVYHLYLPKQFVLHGGFFAVPFSEHAYWPLFAEMSFVPAELFHSLPMAKLISWMVFTSTVGLAASFTYQQTHHAFSSALAALIIASAPVFFFHAPSTYSDIFFNFFLMGAFIIYLEAIRYQGSYFGYKMLLAGLLAGAAMANKYLAGFGVIALYIVMIFDLVRSSDKKRFIMGILALSAGLFLIGAPYYLRSWIHYGNPVFPYAPGIFNTPFGYLEEGAKLLGSNASLEFQGAGRSVKDFFMLPFSLTLAPENFLGDKIGLMFLPAFVFLFFGASSQIRLLSFAFVFALLWFYTGQVSRYFLPPLMIVAMVGSVGLAKLLLKAPRTGKPFVWGMLLLGLFHTGWAGYHAYKDFFIRTEDPKTALAVQINQAISEHHNKVLVLGDAEVYRYNFQAFREKTFRNFTHYPEMPLHRLLELMDSQEIHYILEVNTGYSDYQRPEKFHELIQRGDYSSGVVLKANGLQASVYRRSNHASSSK